MARYGSLRAIRMASAGEIAASVRSIGQQTAARLVSALELGRRLAVEVEDDFFEAESVTLSRQNNEPSPFNHPNSFWSANAVPFFASHESSPCW